MHRRRALLPLFLAFGAVGCQPAAPGSAALGLTQAQLAWGAGDGQVGLRPAFAEAQAQGPSAIALDGAGRAYVLDRLNRRVLRLGERAVAVAAAAPDHELLAVGPDGALALYSPLRARVDLVDADGAAIGALDVPRHIGVVTAVTLQRSRRVTVATALQERYVLGSPSFPLPLPVVLAAHVEGAVALADGRGATLRLDGGALLLRIFGRAARELRVATHADAAMLVGADGDVACARTESLAPGATIEVERRVVCVDTATGAVRLDEALPAPGLYPPRTELAVGGGRVAVLTPTREGVAIASFPLGGGGR